MWSGIRKPSGKPLDNFPNTDLESEDCQLISTNIPSVVAAATSSSSSVSSSASSTKCLLPNRLNRANKFDHQAQILETVDDNRVTGKFTTRGIGLAENNNKQSTTTKTTSSTAADMSLKEMNMLLAGTDLDGTSKKPLTAVYEPCKIQSISRGQPYLRQGLAAFSVSLGSAVVGFSSAYTSPALESMKQPGSLLNITEQQASWIGSLMPLSALLGGIVGGPLIETLGRKKTILLTAIPFWISFIMIAFANNVSMVMVGRSISGFTVGVASLALPVYLGETIQPDVRGTLGLLPTAIGNGGILICFLAGKYLDWSKLALFGACLPIPFFILMFLIPETPRWFIGKKMDKKARKSLEWLRGRNTDVTKELCELQKSTELSEQNSTTIKDLINKKYLWPFTISIGLMFFQQLSGINAVIFYTVTIFKDAGSTIDSNLSAIIVGLVNLGSTLIATALIDRVGRKVLMYLSNCIMAATLITLGTFFYLKNTGTDMTQYGWIPLASFVIYVIGFSIGAGPIPWLMMGEILPAKVRGTAASIVTGFNWACTFLVTKTFVDLTSLLGSHGAFWMFGVICLFGLAFVIIFVPETRGRSLEDIERNFMGTKQEDNSPNELPAHVKGQAEQTRI